MEYRHFIGQPSDPDSRTEGKRYVSAHLREQQPRTQTFQNMLQRANQAIRDHGAKD